MNLKITRFLMKAYLTLRKLWDPLTKPTKVENEYKRTKWEFSKRINSFEYKADPLNGLFDHTADPNLFYDETRKSGRDCDDFQRQWSWWGRYNGCKSYEYVICDPSKIKTAFNTMHVIGTLQDERTGNWYLTNYKIYGPFVLEEDALLYMANFQSYSDNRTIVKYREVK